MENDPEKAVFKILERYSGRKKPEHVREDPFRVLIGCILSQRTKDEVTDKAYARLFGKYKTLKEIAGADPEEVEKLIYPVGFYRIKAKTIIKAAKYVLEHFSGKVPNRFDDLIKIPGIGRKCANIILAYGFGVPAIPVDTHVERVSKRLGLVEKNAGPEDVEKRLEEIVPRDLWIEVNHALIRFGQEICRPVKPLCPSCFVREFCKEYKNMH